MDSGSPTDRPGGRRRTQEHPCSSNTHPCRSSPSLGSLVHPARSVRPAEGSPGPWACGLWSCLMAPGAVSRGGADTESAPWPTECPEHLLALCWAVRKTSEKPSVPFRDTGIHRGLVGQRACPPRGHDKVPHAGPTRWAAYVETHFLTLLEAGRPAPRHWRVSSPPSLARRHLSPPCVSSRSSVCDLQCPNLLFLQGHQSAGLGPTPKPHL